MFQCGLFFDVPMGEVGLGVGGLLRLSKAAENPEELLFPLCCRKTVAHNNEARWQIKQV